jgi:hypothetical protein
MMEREHLKGANLDINVEFGKALSTMSDNVVDWVGTKGARLQATAKLQASVAAAILMSSPSMMINFALGSFLTGIGVYLGFVWQDELDAIAGKSGSRKVFVCFLISLVFCYSFYVLPSISKLWEDNKKSARKRRLLSGHLLPVFLRMQYLCQLQRIKPEMMSTLLPSLKRLTTMGVRAAPWDDRWLNEAMKDIKSIKIELDNWGFPDEAVLGKEALEDMEERQKNLAEASRKWHEEIEKRQKETTEALKRIEMAISGFRVRGEDSRTGGDKGLNVGIEETKDQNGKEIVSKTSTVDNIDLESGLEHGNNA